MPTAAEDHNALGLVAKVLGVTLLAVGLAVVFVFAAAAAAVIGLMILGAAIALRFAPEPVRFAEGAGPTLDARRTPDGWVVETRTRRSS